MNKAKEHPGQYVSLPRAADIAGVSERACDLPGLPGMPGFSDENCQEGNGFDVIVSSSMAIKSGPDRCYEHAMPALSINPTPEVEPMSSKKLSISFHGVKELSTSAMSRAALMPAKCVPKSLRAIESLLFQFPRLPKVGSCVYFLLQGNEVVYVGQTKDLLRRLLDHHSRGKPTRLLYMKVPARYRREVEKFFIRDLKPRLNNTTCRASDDEFEIPTEIRSALGLPQYIGTFRGI